MSNKKELVVFRYDLPLDDEWHSLPIGKVAMIESRQREEMLSCVGVWIEQRQMEQHAFKYRVFGTGHNIDTPAEHVGSTVAEPFVWHVYRQMISQGGEAA